MASLLIGQVTKGEVFRADDVEDGWVRFTRNGRTGYVSEEYVKVRYMLDLAEQYPQYAFEKHKGYGTALHYSALREYGPSPVHRT